MKRAREKNGKAIGTAIVKPAAIFFLVISLVLMSGCDLSEKLKGSTEVLDANPIETLLERYDEEFVTQNAGKDPNEDKPTVQSVIFSQTGSEYYYVVIRVVNNSVKYDLTVYGYGYITDGKDEGYTSKLLFFNTETNVANSTYGAVIPPKGTGADLSFEVQTPPVNLTPETVAFIFFAIDGIDYVGGATVSNNFTYWQL